MADIINFPAPPKKEETDAEIEIQRNKLMSLYATMEHTLKEINYTKQVIRMLEKGTKHE
jgi:hypothetical protein